MKKRSYDCQRNTEKEKQLFLEEGGEKKGDKRYIPSSKMPNTTQW